MKRTVRVIVRDYPKRSEFFRSSIDVEADSDDQAIELGRVAAAEKWPGGKITAYDVDRILSHQIAAVEGAEKRPTLKAKAKVA